MAAPAPILIPFEAEDNTGAVFDALNSGFDNLAMQAEAADRAFAGLADQADATGGALGGFGDILGTLADQMDGAAGAASRLIDSLNAFDPLSKVSGIDAMAAAYGRLADQIRNAATAGQHIPSIGGGVPVATGGGGLSPTDQLLQDATMHSLHQQGLIDDQGNPIPQAAHGGASGHGVGGLLGGFGGTVWDAAKNYGVYGGLYAGYSALKDSMDRVQATGYAAAGEGAQLGMTPGDVASMQSQNAAYQMSGQTVYNQETLNNAAYVPKTFGTATGTPDQQARAIRVGQELGQASGLADPTSAESAITYGALAYGPDTDPTATANYIQETTLRSGFTLQDIAANAGSFLPGAAKRGISESDAFAAYGAESGTYGEARSGQAAQDFNVLLRELGGNANAQQRYSAGKFGLNLGDANLIGDSGGYENLLKTIMDRTGADGPAKQEQIIQSMFGPQAGEALFAQTQSGFGAFDANRTSGQDKDDQGKAVGAFQTAYERTQQSGAVQLAESENKLAGEFDNLTKQLLPLEKPLIDALGYVVTSLNDFATAIGTGRPGKVRTRRHRQRHQARRARGPGHARTGERVCGRGDG